MRAKSILRFTGGAFFLIPLLAAVCWAEDGLTPERLLESSIYGGEYLMRHQKPDGSFGYHYDAGENRFMEGYNLLRHAGAVYALSMLYEVSRDERCLRSSHAGLKCLLQHVKPSPPGATPEFECLATEDGAIGNLGGTALAILALNEHSLSSGNSSWNARAKKLGNFLLHQQASNGRFQHRYALAPGKSATRETIYYPGEAILALTRLYQADNDRKWLAAAEKGAAWLIDVRDATSTIADHWLLMAMNELYAATRQEKYIKHTGRIVDSIMASSRTVQRNGIDLLAGGDPPSCAATATRAEGLTAAWFLYLESGRKETRVLEGLKGMCGYLLACQASERNSAGISDMRMAHGGFCHTLEDAKMRIDYVQHAVCALLGLREILLEVESAR